MSKPFTDILGVIFRFVCALLVWVMFIWILARLGPARIGIILLALASTVLGIPALFLILGPFALALRYIKRWKIYRGLHRAAAAAQKELQQQYSVHDEDAQFSIFRPHRIEPDVWYTMLVFAIHSSATPTKERGRESDTALEVQKQARRILGDELWNYQLLTQDSPQAVPRQSHLKYVAHVPGVEFNPPFRQFRWCEPIQREEFRLRASKEMEGKTARGSMLIYLGNILIAEVAIALQVCTGIHEKDSNIQEPSIPENATHYRKIFASYSHQDLPIVEQFQRFVSGTGDEFMRDWTHLRAGQVWSDRLQQMIGDADIFQLFWSHNSMRSPYVRQEYEYALSLNRPHFIRPVYWETPLPEQPEAKLPPDELRKLHFQKLELVSAPPEVRTPRWSDAQIPVATTPSVAPLSIGGQWGEGCLAYIPFLAFPLATLKLFNVITWSWWWVLWWTVSPAWTLLGLILVGLVVQLVSSRNRKIT